MVGLVLVSHSRRLAEAAVDLIKRTIGPDIAIAAAGGVGDDRVELGTDAVDIQEAILSVCSADGVLVLMDMGSAILSAETAKDLLGSDMPEPVLLSSASLVEGSIAAAVQIQIGSVLSDVANAAKQGLVPKEDQLGDSVFTGAAIAPEPSSPGKELKFTIGNPHGLHLRPAATLIKTLAPFAATVQIENQSAKRGPIAVKSLVDLGRLHIRQGDSVRFTVSGPDDQAALAAITELVQTNFGESASTPQPAPAVPLGTPAAGKPFPVSAGIAVGKPLFLDQIEASIPDYTVTDEQGTREEIEKLQAALQRSDTEFALRYERFRSSLDPETLAILDAQRLILSDGTILAEVESIIRKRHCNAARAWHTVLSGLASEQEAIADEYLRGRAADFREVRSLVVAQLTEGLPQLQFSADARNVILVCDELTPSLADAIRQSSIEGVLQLYGGTTSHGAILARALRLPSIGGAAGLTEQIRDAEGIAFDGTNGALWINPSQEDLAKLDAERQAGRVAFEASLIESQRPALTKDGIQVNVAANAGSRADIEQAVQYGADSIGLFRSEFLFQKFVALPAEAEQLAAYRDALAPLVSQVVTLRLLDIGGDKPLEFLTVPHEMNPFLGVRGIRLLLRNQPFLRSHLRAIIRLSAEHQLKILVPMVTDRLEMLILKNLLSELHSELDRDHLPHAWPIPLGAMIETPAAALLADQLALDCDFLSFGTNDLTQYVLCAERGNPLLNTYSDALHPAVLRICQQAIDLARPSKIPVSICGEIASDPEALPIWLGLGLRNLSVTPASIPNIKSLIRKLDISRIAPQVRNPQRSFSTAETVRSFAKNL
jgi:phosphoenolpyruvate-protein phosphotransferase/dihydroxyacetone kinase phosphotransfer subunit